MRAGAVIVYVAVLVGVVLMADAGIGKAYLVWEAASFCLGWVSGSQRAVLLPFIAIPLAVPFGHAKGWTGDDHLPLCTEVLVAAPVQAAIVFVGFGGRGLLKRFRAPRR
jgi:hypothetical protein